MKRADVDLITYQVAVDMQIAIEIKIYRDGRVERQGVGGVPAIDVIGQGDFATPRIFNQLLKNVPDALIENPVHYEEETPNGYLQYVVTFYGERDPHAQTEQWLQTSCIKVKLDRQSKFKHAIMRFLEAFVLDAAKHTDNWYFDLMILSCYQMQICQSIPTTLLSAPCPSEAVIANYLEQMVASGKKEDLYRFIRNKYYKKGNQDVALRLHENAGKFTLSVIEKPDQSRWRKWFS